MEFRNFECNAFVFFCVLNLLVHGLSGDNAVDFSACQKAIGCHCDDLEYIVGVTCHGVTDFAPALSNGSLFPINETYEITLSGISYVPQGILRDLIVYKLYIDEPDLANVSLLAFDGVYRLRKFYAWVSALEVIPNLSLISNSLRNIRFERSALKSLNGEAQNLPLLTELALRNSLIESVAEDAFRGTQGLTIVDFSNNQLTTLPPGLFDDLPELKKLVLAYNRLLHLEGVLKKVRPKFLFLQRNNLSDADHIFYPNMTEVETVHLTYNPLKAVSSNTFNGKIPNVRFIYMDYCQISEFDVRHYKSLKNLTELNLSGNLIRRIRNQTIDFGYKLNLELNSNKIEAFEAELTFNVMRLYLSGNSLQYLRTTLQLTQLTEVEVNSNQLKAILDSDMRGMHSTENLSFRNNSISRIDSEVFRTLRNDLHTLDLSVNQIQSLNGSVSYLSQLKSLNASHNSIAQLAFREFIGLNELSELFLQHNQIAVLGGQLQSIPQLQYLIVQYNQVKNIRIEQLPRSLRYLYLKENPLQCNCGLLPFLQWIEDDRGPKTEIQLCRKSNEETTHLGSFACPDRCECSCAHDVNGSYVAMNCRSQNLTDISRLIPRRPQHPSDMSSLKPYGIEITSVTSFVVHQNTDEKFDVADHVFSMDFEDNLITSLENWNPPRDLKSFYLARNRLKLLSDAVIQLPRLRVLSLADNPWACNCSLMEFKTWIISKTDAIIDVNETRCDPNEAWPQLSNKLIVALTDADLCPSSIGFYVTLSFIILGFLFMCASFIIAYNRYEIHIKIWLYSHGLSCVREEDIDGDKLFDAFVSFSHKDEALVVDAIADEIERRLPNIRLCLHTRNFPPGEFIQVNIFNAVHNSKRTVLVLSKNFLESEWCLMEFRAAHLQALEDRVHRLIVIKVGELPEDELDPAIKVYLESTTYLTWGEKYFWKKLLYALPVSNSHPYNSSFDGSQVILT